MSHECIYCGAELVYEDTWGVGAYWKQDNKPEGEILQCPNHQGFEDNQEALDYIEANKSDD